MESIMKQINELQHIIDHARNIVFFTGAGVSTDSGIPDFRSTDGLYNMSYDYSAETIISHSFFLKNPKEFYRFYRDKMVYEQAKPSITHLFIAQCEAKGISLGVITQNIDGLHQAAGSRNVLELHGSILRAYCARCRKIYPESIINHGQGIPRCGCGGVIRPDIVLYEEQLDQDVLYKSVDYIRNADVLIIGGTSLNVYPAAGLINYYRGNKLVLVNLSQTPYDSEADLVINEKIGEVFSQI
jgi:NAD-dependent deacetylase